ncbi:MULTISPECIES: FCD domain-containing protein [unclassified Ruegeria]|uniref:FCD domain-containing protein n=1 Tax=unclassified Ruegeria TaxID=2625375 RepID=UPI001C2BD55A
MPALYRPVSDKAIGELTEANQRCNVAVEEQDSEKYYCKNEQFHAIWYRESGNSFLEQECLRFQRRLQPFLCREEQHGALPPFTAT